MDSAAAAPASSSQTSHRTIRVSRTSSPPPRTRRTPPRLRRSVFARLRRRLRRAPSLHSTIASRLPHRPIQTTPTPTTTTTPHARRARSRPRPRRPRAPPRAPRPRHPNDNLHAHRHRFRARRHRVRATSFDTSPRASSSLATTTRARSRTTPSSVARTNANASTTSPHSTAHGVASRRSECPISLALCIYHLLRDEYARSVCIQKSSHTQQNTNLPMYLCIYGLAHTHAHTSSQSHAHYVVSRPPRPTPRSRGSPMRGSRLVEYPHPSLESPRDSSSSYRARGTFDLVARSDRSFHHARANVRSHSHRRHV